MEIRRLELWEHERTRALYEKVFSEDDRAFVDYYYKWKTRDSIICAAEDEDGIHAMVHLNPFRMYVDGQVQRIHYIVAVATQREYRHRGLMRSLLELAEREMKAAGEPLTFLMPASEKIYHPFGYRYFGWQRRGRLCSHTAELFTGFSGKTDGTAGDGTGAVSDIAADSACGIQCRPVREDEYGMLAHFVNRVLLAQYTVFTYRDASYYERLSAEQHCQNGEVMAVIRGGQGEVIGTFCTALDLQPNGDRKMMIREIIYDPDALEEVQQALENYVGVSGSRARESGTAVSSDRGDGSGTAVSSDRGAGSGTAVSSDLGAGSSTALCGCVVEGCMPGIRLEQETIVPLMMGKVPCGGQFASSWEPDRVFLNEVV